jgi:outer membrane protein TolC
MHRLSLLIIFLGIFITAPFTASGAEVSGGGPEKTTEIADGGVLHLERCLEIALRKQPGIRAARGQAAASQSRIGQAEADYYPKVDLSAGYNSDHSVSSVNRTRARGDYYSNSVTLSQNIYDFGRTSSQVRIQELNTDAFRSELHNTVSLTVFNVKQAYYGLLQTRRNREVAEETIKQFEKQLEQARGFFEAGVRPRFDVTRAEVDLSNAKVNLIRADNDIRLFMSRLKNAMGVPDAPDFDIKDDLEIRKYEITLEEATAKALRARQDLRASGARKRAVEESVTLANRGYYPFVSGNADYTWAGDGYPLDDGWSAGVTITLPLFSGFLTRHQVRESKANLEVTSANEDIVRQNIMFEVQQAYFNLREADERIPAAELVLRQAHENLEIANGRYATGVGSPIEVTDAAVAYINARTSFVQALTDYKTAGASLERAMGERDGEDETK